MSDNKVVEDVRRAKEPIKEQFHKDDNIKTAVSGAITAGVVGIAGGITSTTAAGLGPITIGGPLGTWLVSHGILSAVTIVSPVFWGIALPAIGIYTGYNIIKINKANKLLKDFTTSANIDSLGEKIAEAVFLPVIYFLKTMSVNQTAICEELTKEMIKEYGFSDLFTRKFLTSFSSFRIEDLKTKILNQDVSIQLLLPGGKEKKSKELKLSFLHKKSIKICKDCLNKACFDFDEKSLVRGKETINFIRKELFKSK